jgi:hypothetical protein
MVDKTFEEILLEEYKKPGPPFLFHVGQKVRIKSTLTSDTHEIEEMLGHVGLVEKRYQTGLHKENWYHVRLGTRVEPFREHELDKRYARERKHV